MMDTKPVSTHTQQQPERITPQDYMWAAKRTLYPDLTIYDRLGLCGLGLPGEMGEVVDLLKKCLYHRNGKPLDTDKIKDELGDVLWYLFVLLDTVGLTPLCLMEIGALRLKQRCALHALYSDLSHKGQLELCGLELTIQLGKVVDLLVQFLYYHVPLDVDKLKDELGNVFLYLSLLLNTLGLTLEEVMQTSTNKLERRHPNGFNPRYASDSGASE